MRVTKLWRLVLLGENKSFYNSNQSSFTIYDAKKQKTLFFLLLEKGDQWPKFQQQREGSKKMQHPLIGYNIALMIAFLQVDDPCRDPKMPLI